MTQNNYFINKLIKYTSKINNMTSDIKKHHIIQKGGIINKKYIICDGTGSSGKTTLCKHFATLGYKCIMVDDIWGDVADEESELLKNIPNEYRDKEKWYAEKGRELMINHALKNPSQKAFFDDISQKELLSEFEKRGLMQDVYVIVLYTNLRDMARNLESRRKEGDTRGVSAFEQFGKRYIITESSDDKIDTVNRQLFRELLLDYFKYEFINYAELDMFANKVFLYMNINDDNDHYIKLKEEYKYDYILNTSNKSKQEIYDELNNIESDIH